MSYTHNTYIYHYIYVYALSKFADFFDLLKVSRISPPGAKEGPWDPVGGPMGTHGTMGGHWPLWKPKEGPFGPMGPPGGPMGGPWAPHIYAGSHTSIYVYIYL